MWFLAWLSAGVVIGFLLAGLCNISARCDEQYLERYPDLAKRIRNAA
jgi:hypothetical protein